MLPAFTSTLWDAALALWASGYAKAPALMLGLTALALVPVLVLVGAVVVALSRRARPAVTPEAPSDADGPTLSWRRGPATGSLRRGDVTTARISAATPLVRIGRHDDNDIRIETATAHRYHAIVHRGDDGRFWLVDVSGDDGNGIRVNGEKVQRRHLAAGDRIEIGGETLTFAYESARRST